MLAGENGAGKSTLKNILCGLLTPDSGTLQFNDSTFESFTTRDAERLGIGTIHQELSLFENLSVAENIFISELPRTSGIINGNLLLEKAKILIERELGMTIDVEREVGGLSLGERQMVEIAKALSRTSNLIIFDEPTTCLSNPERQALFRIVRRLKGQGYAIVYITHFMEEVYELGDRVVVLRDGKVAGEGPLPKIPLTELAKLMVGREIASSKTNVPSVSFDAPKALEVIGLNDGVSIRDVSLSVQAGEVLGLGGLLGAGRSEIGEAIFGIRPAAGRVLIFGKPFEHRTPEKAKQLRIAFVSEDRRKDQAFLIRSVKENVTASNLAALMKTIIGWISSSEENATAHRICDQFDVVTPGIREPMAALSGGNQQKAIIGRWLDGSPRICILDEPTKGVDIGARETIHQLIAELAHDGVAIILISSDLPELLALSHRIVVLHKGRTAAAFTRGQASADALIAAASTGVVQ
jgi:ABC-type sugar transport system ATPase subunit